MQRDWLERVIDFFSGLMGGEPSERVHPAWLAGLAILVAGGVFVLIARL